MPQPRNKYIKDKVTPTGNTFVTWEPNDKEALKSAQAAVGKAYASASNLSVRNGMDRNDYEFFRPGESIPKNRAEILSACVGAYDRVSPIKDIIDMMVDFTTQGIRLVHRTPQVQEFYQMWWDKVNGTDRSQHFANNFYLMGTAIAKRNLAKLSAKVVDDLRRGLASVEQSDVYDLQPLSKNKQPKNVVPWSYNFLNPETVSVVGGDLAIFAGKPRYGLEIPRKLIQAIKNARTPEEKAVINTLPAYIINAVRAGNKTIILDESRVAVFHYKKRDWQQWANPILYSIMDDIVLLQKMKLTDLAALDGAISHIRIWKLGSLEHRIMPTQEAFQALNDALINAGNGQSLDLLWGPDLTLEETTSDIHKYLGQEKYVPVLSSIYSGLGVPPTLVGGSGGEKGFTNNSLSLKTLIERLKYGRGALTRFWENEVAIVQQAMQFRYPAQIEFKNDILVDEASFHSMMIDLLDRDVISVERVREHLGYIPEIEDALVKYEWKSRNNSKMPPKAGPFHDAEHDYGFKKIFAQTGVVTPSQLGLDLPNSKPGEKNALQLRTTTKPSATPVKKGQQGEGRPRNSKDTVPRKTKRVSPRASTDDSEFMSLFLWAKEAQQAISDIVNPVYLKMCNKKNMRSLTTAEVEDVEHIKFAILCNIEPYSEIGKTTIGGMIQKPLPAHPEADDFWRVLVATYLEKRQTQPTVDDIRQIQSYVYALYKGEYNGKDYS